jgi:Mrp family chromosome partitioning ATPase
VIDEEINRIALSARNEFDSAQANEDALRRNLDTLKRTTMTTNEAMVALRELDRDVQASRAVYESFLVRARETGEQERLDTNNVRVISTADLPLRRSWPPSNTLMALGAILLGLTGSTGFVLLWPPGSGSRKAGESGAAGPPPRKPAEWRPQAVEAPHAVYAPQAVEPPPGVPVLAVLPRVAGPQPLNPLADLKSRLAIEMRKVHDAVRANHTKRTGPSILVVSDDEDDATAVALNLASVAAATQRVLLIDADQHRRTLATLMPDQTDGGLVDVAVGRKALADVVVRHPQSNINLLPLISRNSLRRGKIKDDDLRAAFEQTKSFDMAIVAARNCDRDPSARFFAGLVDHIVLVGRAGVAGKAEIDRIIATLGIDPGSVRGTVLTGARAA